MILGNTYYLDFITSSPTSGSVVDADALPTVEVFEDNSDTSIYTPTVTKRVGKTGNYRIELEVTTANGFELSKNYNVVATAIVATITGKGIVSTFTVGNSEELLLKQIKALVSALQ